MKLYDLYELIAAVCPIDGINSDGAIFYRPEATDPQRLAAQVAMDANLPRLNGEEDTDYGTINAKALVRRRAEKLQQSGQAVAALLLLKTIGE